MRATYRSTSLTADGEILNISQGGLFLGTGSRDAVGTEAEVIIGLPHDAGPLVVRGVVAWVGSGDQGMGISFRPLGRKPRMTLANFLLARSQKD